MNRRQFLRTTSLIGTSLARAGANDRIRVAIIGLGRRGMVLLPAAAKMPGVEVVALCDPDREHLQQAAMELEKATGKKARLETDMRRLMDDPNIDAVTVSTCNHWHALAGIWACQAGKHVYMEKPVSHNITEGRKLVQAPRKYNRIVQGGTQRRSSGRIRKAMQLLHGGVIGDIYMARAIVFGVRDSIGFQPLAPPPLNLDWNLWLGPAPQQQYHANLVHYNWHWFWDFGNGELGNNGSHQIDVARWGLRKGLPSKVYSTGGRLGYKDQAQTPNTQIATYDYPDATILVCETRGLYTNAEGGVRWGVHFYGSKGYMSIDPKGMYQIFQGRSEKPEPDPGALDEIDHYANFFDAVPAGRPELLTADIEETYLSNAICHLGNISYRTGRKLNFDPKTERFVGDGEADRLLTRQYRAPFLMPDRV
jgi:predicted dehydrogenase